ncbi:MAG: hypothetical protein JSW54_08460, partial [Fidelibacterota bacterium]
MSKRSITGALILALAVQAGYLWATAPHPRYYELLRQGLISEPYYLRNRAELQQAGVDAPWILQRRELQKGLSETDQFPALDPARFPSGELNALVILVDFPDSTARTNPAYFDSLIFSDTTASVHD